MSEELTQKRLTEHGLRIGEYEFFNIGSSTLNQLKKCKIVPDRDYKEYGIRKPDALLVDRRNKSNIKVICVTEVKDSGKFKSNADKTETIRQCNDVCQILEAEVGIATDLSSFVWFNPRQNDPLNNYTDQTTGMVRNFALIKDENGGDFIKEFVIDQTQDEQDPTKLSVKTRKSIQNLELVRRSISPINSRLVKETTIDPTNLAKQIWQDVWSVTGATPEKCLYTFVELFIFKYLSDLDVLTEDDKGNRINFKDIFSLGSKNAFKNYTQNVRPYLKVMFPESLEDNTTIINGTVLNPKVAEHSEVFYKILNRFKDFGEMKNIDPSFKSKVFEEFMKETISKKNWGQFFTPRNIIDAMIEISDIDKLEEGSEICDPACGVGGFILEPFKVKKNGINFYFQVEGNNIKSRYKFYAFDKGFDREEQMVIILAKANMLIFLSELIKKNPTLSQEFSQLFNSTFKLLSNTILGTLSKTEKDRYDLILTNPPYVTSGSSNYKNAIEKDEKLRAFYLIRAMGAEGLFLEWIVRSLRPSKKAFIIVPDGILNRVNDNKLREFIKDECILDGIISLPIDAFYRNPKKTYILAITKKPEKSEIERKEHKQTEPVFTYLVSNIGETLDVRRFTIEDNDLNETVSLFNQFKGAKTSFRSPSKRCKIQSIDRFDPNQHWSVDRWWSKEEKIELGIEEKENIVSSEDFVELLKSKSRDFDDLVKKAEQALVQNTSNGSKATEETKQISLSDSKFFRLSIGRRVLKRELFFNRNPNHKIPLFSANVNKEFGFVEKPNLAEFDHNSIIWGIDGNFELRVMPKGKEYAITDHCGSIEILNDQISPDFLNLLLDRKKYELGFDRSLRASLKNVKQIIIEISINSNGNFDLNAQERVVQNYRPFSEIQKSVQRTERNIEDITVSLESEYPHVEDMLSNLFTIRQGNAYYTRKRVIGNGWVGNIPVYSSNTENNGLLMTMDLGHIRPRDLYYQHCLTWSIDGYIAGKLFVRNPTNIRNEKKQEFYFTINNHSGILLPKVEGLYLPFMKHILQPLFDDKVKGYGNNKLGTNQIEDITVKIPINSTGEFDIAKQKEISQRYDMIENLKASYLEHLNAIAECKIIAN